MVETTNQFLPPGFVVAISAPILSPSPRTCSIYLGSPRPTLSVWSLYLSLFWFCGSDLWNRNLREKNCGLLLYLQIWAAESNHRNRLEWKKEPLLSKMVLFSPMQIHAGYMVCSCLPRYFHTLFLADLGSVWTILNQSNKSRPAELHRIDKGMLADTDFQELMVQ